MFNNLTNYIKETKPLISTILEHFFDGKISLFKAVSSQSSSIEMLTKLKEITSNEGKTIRPIIALCTFQMLTNKELTQAEIEAACSLELIHKFLVIHDDIADNDRIRYGKENLFGFYENKGLSQFKKSAQDAERYGISVSMVSGDLNHAFAYEILQKSSHHQEIKDKLFSELHRIIDMTCFGWKEESEMTQKTIEDVSSDDLLNNLKYITPIYTTDGPTKFGAILSKASEKDFKTLEEFSIPLGIAFQITDDLLGLYGIEAGQDLKSDITDNKKTLHIIYAFEKASEEDKKFLLEKYGTKITEEDLERVKDIVTKTGAKEYAENYANKLMEKALSALKTLPFDNKYKTILEELALFAVKREK